MRLTSGCHARCSSFVLKSMDVPSVGAPPGTAAASGAGAGLDSPFCSAARFALLPLDSPNLPCDCTHSAWASDPYMGLIDHAGSNSQHATALSTSSQDAKADRSRTSSSLQRKNLEQHGLFCSDDRLQRGCRSASLLFSIPLKNPQLLSYMS